MMRSLRALAAARRSVGSPGRRVPPHLRCLSTHPDAAAAAPDEEPRNLVLVEGRASSRNAILNRPSSLNAITTSMAARLTKLYNSWEENPDIGQPYEIGFRSDGEREAEAMFRAGFDKAGQIGPIRPNWSESGPARCVIRMDPPPGRGPGESTGFDSIRLDSPVRHAPLRPFPFRFARHPANRDCAVSIRRGHAASPFLPHFSPFSLKETPDLHPRWHRRKPLVRTLGGSMGLQWAVGTITSATTVAIRDKEVASLA
ncbi:hypothetical protein Taro_013360 [Colocasia esculenta]|uniref:Uncharacterized protein n=1 Tax=Colocasia esculenta TaxID=4460 RepID=A0A843ULY9_COLES|nr:hypothetical protein [Colocasia esculenta]